MFSWHQLPPVPLKAEGPITAKFLTFGVADFRGAGRYLQALPYGRTANRADYHAVLHEMKGTCSTKHAVLAVVAHEQHLPVVLMLGIYEMHERNTPGVGSVLARHGLASLPEAHCYLLYAGKRIDITRSGAESSQPITDFLHEEVITPEQIGDYKVTVHRNWMQAWLTMNGEKLKGRTLEELWRIREQCIAALTELSVQRDG